MNEGWIKLHRSLLEWEWYDDINVFRLFTHLLLTANHAPRKWKGFQVLSGQTVTGRKALSDGTKLSEMQVRTALNKLKKTNEITIKSTKHFSIISITNWEKWQQGNQLDNQQVTNKQPTGNQQVTTNNKDNNGRIKESKSIEQNKFDDFWKAYPEKKGKGDARKVFSKVLKKVDIETIISGVMAYIKNKPKDISYCHPATFLNNERWADEYAPAKKKIKAYW